MPGYDGPHTGTHSYFHSPTHTLPHVLSGLCQDSVPEIEGYPDGQTVPSPEGIDFTPGELLGCVSGELGLRKYLESNGHTLVVTSDKVCRHSLLSALCSLLSTPASNPSSHPHPQPCPLPCHQDGADSVLDRELADADIVISQPFYPAYITAERIEKAPKLKMAITAGIGSDHVDLQAAMDRKVDVMEVTFCNSISVAEHVVMMILGLVRNYIPSYHQVVNGGWNIADCVQRAYDVEGMHVGTVASGRIGLAVLRRLAPFDCKLHYTDRHRLPESVEKELNLVHHDSVEDMIKVCDVVTINCPLHRKRLLCVFSFVCLFCLFCLFVLFVRLFECLSLSLSLPL